MTNQTSVILDDMTNQTSVIQDTTNQTSIIQDMSLTNRTSIIQDIISGVPATYTGAVAPAYLIEQRVLVTIFSTLALLFLIQTIYKFLLHRHYQDPIGTWTVNVKTTFQVCGLISATLNAITSVDFNSKLGIINEEWNDVLNVCMGFFNAVALFAYIYVAVKSLALGKSFDASLYYERGIITSSLVLYLVACTLTSVLLFMTHKNWPKCIYIASTIAILVIMLSMLNYAYYGLYRNLKMFTEGTAEYETMKAVVRRWERFTITASIMLIVVLILEFYLFTINYRDRSLKLNAGPQNPGKFVADFEEYVLYAMEFGWLFITLWFSWEPLHFDVFG
eukprot:811191_1